MNTNAIRMRTTPPLLFLIVAFDDEFLSALGESTKAKTSYKRSNDMTLAKGIHVKMKAK